LVCGGNPREAHELWKFHPSFNGIGHNGSLTGEPFPQCEKAHTDLDLEAVGLFRRKPDEMAKQLFNWN